MVSAFTLLTSDYSIVPYPAQDLVLHQPVGSQAMKKPMFALAWRKIKERLLSSVTYLREMFSTYSKTSRSLSAASCILD